MLMNPSEPFGLRRKRNATPLSDRRKSGVALRLPPQSKTAHWQA